MKILSLANQIFQDVINLILSFIRIADPNPPELIELEMRGTVLYPICFLFLYLNILQNCI